MTPGHLLPRAVLDPMRDIGIADGIGAVGYADSDIVDLADGSTTQQRLLGPSPRPVPGDDLARIFRRSLSLW